MKIQVNGIKLYAYHGCSPDEAIIGTNFIVDCDIDFDFTEAALTDDLSKTVDYCKVYELVKNEMAIRADLIETVVYRIHQSILKNIPIVKSVTVKLTKLDPPINGNVESTTVIYP